MPKWIDAKDRLPEKEDEYIVVQRNGKVTTAWYSLAYTTWFDIEFNTYANGAILYWMPFPKPPKNLATAEP